MVASVLSSLALSVGSTSFLTGASNPAASLVMSCIPIIVPMSVNRLSDSTVLTFLSEDGKNFIKGITYVSIGQGTLAMADFVFGDLLSGFMKAIFAGLGLYISHMDDGISVLPSFTVVSFVNGCIAMLSAFERMSARRTPLFSGFMPLYLNYIHLSQLVHPLLCFAGAYMGWQIIKELRRTGLAQSSTLITENPGATVSTGRVLSGLSGSDVASGQSFTPFTGRGHSLSRQTSLSVRPAEEVVGQPSN